MTLTEVLARLEARGSDRNVESMRRYGIVAKKVYGVPAFELRALAKRIGKNQSLSLQLWRTGVYDARILATLIGNPGQVTVRQMERWVKDFDSWAICDSCCGNLFDKTPFAYTKASEWSRRKGEFERRAGFALMAWLAVHDKKAHDRMFERFLPIIARAATDERGMVKKAVNWALRQIGKRNIALHRAAIRTAVKIQKMDSPAARWIAAGALRELRNPRVLERLREKSRRTVRE